MAGRNGRIRPVEALLAPAVAEAVAAAVLSSEDVATQRLVERYAAAIDEAAVLAAEAAEIEPDDDDMAVRLRRLAQRVEAQQVLADLGPKLLAALEALGASPRARAAMAKGKSAPTGSGKLAALRGGRAG